MVKACLLAKAFHEEDIWGGGRLALHPKLLLDWFSG